MRGGGGRTDTHGDTFRLWDGGLEEEDKGQTRRRMKALREEIGFSLAPPRPGAPFPFCWVHSHLSLQHVFIASSGAVTVTVIAARWRITTSQRNGDGQVYKDLQNSSLQALSTTIWHVTRTWHLESRAVKKNEQRNENLESRPPVFLSARPCRFMATVCGRRPHGSRMQQTFCFVSRSSPPASASVLCRTVC